MTITGSPMAQWMELEPSERLLVGIIRQAIRDARMGKTERVREEAARAGGVRLAQQRMRYTMSPCHVHILYPASRVP